jgi:hypothetical protein
VLGAQVEQVRIGIRDERADDDGPLLVRQPDRRDGLGGAADLGASSHVAKGK